MKIKFRAIDEFSDDFIFGQAFYIDSDNKQGYISNGIDRHDCVKKETVGQFINITDIEDKEIYADDLMKDSNGVIFRIYAVQGGFAIKAHYWKSNTKDLIYSDDLILEPLADAQTRGFIQQCKVIGNVYECK